MALSPFSVALNQVCEEKGLSKDIVVQTVEAALAAAYRREYGKPKQIVRTKLNEDDLTKTEIFQVFKVVTDEDFKDENYQMTLKDAKKHHKTVKIDEEISLPLEAKQDFGRIAAQTAKQVIIQRLQEAERSMILEEYKSKEGQLINGTIQQIEGNNIIVNLGRINAIMPANEQVHNERYYPGQRLKTYVLSAEESSRGPRIIVSRSHPNLIAGLFASEVPEIPAKTVLIQGIAREAGSRTKISVSAEQAGLDPVGSCVGQRGIRVQAVLSEIGEEKIDIILWDKETEKYIINALAPAKITKIKLNKKQKKARVYVAEDQLSLAIGKNGQNVRLASKLSGWGIDIEKALEEGQKKTKEPKNEKTDKPTKPEESKDETPEKETNKKITPKKTPKQKIKIQP